MGSIDVAKVITAAAASSLGVLSLLILAVAFVGYNFFKRSGDRVKIGVFAVMALAGIGFGVSVVREGRSATAQSAPSTDATPAPRSSPSSDPQPSVTTTTDTAENISGRWHDDDGYVFDIRTIGTALSYDAFNGGAKVGSARGTIVGNRLTYTYSDDRSGDRGTCTGSLASDGKRIAGTCTSGGRTWDFAIER